MAELLFRESYKNTINPLFEKTYEDLEILPERLLGWNNEAPVFSNLITELRPKVIIEVGTWLGGSALRMARDVKRAELGTRIFCVDTWLGGLEFLDAAQGDNARNLMRKNGYPQVYYQFLSNVVHHGMQDIIQPFPTTSTLAAKYFLAKGQQAELIYVDASHEEEDVYQDIMHYFKLLTPGGVMFGDDFSWPGVRASVERSARELNLVHGVTETWHWVIRKPF